MQGTRLLKNLISETDAHFRNYNNIFDELLQQFRNTGRAAGDTLVVVHRIWESVKGLETLGSISCTEIVMPVLIHIMQSKTRT